MSGVFDYMKAHTVAQGLHSGDGATIWMFLYMSITQFLFDVLRQLADVLKGVLQKVVARWVERGKTQLATLEVTVADEPATLVVHTYVRPYGASVRPAEHAQADAILHDVTSRPEVRRLLINGDLTLLHSTDRVPVKDGITFRQVRVEYSDADVPTRITFELSCDGAAAAAVLAQYEQAVLQEFTVNRQNSFDTRVYYFDEVIEPELAVLRPDGSVGRRPRDAMRFTKHEFVTGRTFDNMFFHQDAVVRDRFRFFLRNRSWYDAKGIPYCLGMLLHGPPGCGKTSAIKAIANESHRHILNVNLSRLHSKKLLKQLFYDPMLEVARPTASGCTSVDSVYVPIEKRLFVIEDADCLLDTLLHKRTTVTGTPPAAPGGPPEGPHVAEPDDASDLLYGAEPLPVAPVPHKPPPVSDDDLDLSTVLNILDGVLETPGRILVLTTNHPEAFDDALLRPGRIDMIVNFRKCNAAMLAGMARLYYDDDTGLGDEELDAAAAAVPDGKWTPAEVTSVLLRHFHSRAAVWDTLRHAEPHALFGGW